MVFYHRYSNISVKRKSNISPIFNTQSSIKIVDTYLKVREKKKRKKEENMTKFFQSHVNATPCETFSTWFSLYHSYIPFSRWKWPTSKDILTFYSPFRFTPPFPRTRFKSARTSKTRFLKRFTITWKKRGWLSSETWENPSDFSNADAFDYENGSAMLGKLWIGAI